MTHHERAMIRSAKEVAVQRLLGKLSEQQFLHPHDPLRDVLLQVAEAEHVAPAVIDASLRWLTLDSHLAVGRLRRTELAQLARTVDRLRRQSRVSACKS